MQKVVMAYIYIFMKLANVLKYYKLKRRSKIPSIKNQLKKSRLDINGAERVTGTDP
jgi:hypothetical protein